MLQQLFSHRPNYAILFLFVALIFYVSIGFAIDIPTSSDAPLPVPEDSTFLIVAQTSPPARAAARSQPVGSGP